MNEKAYIITYRFYDFEKQLIRIGGIETYTNDLSQLLKRMGYSVTIYTLLSGRQQLNTAEVNGISIVEVDKGKGNDFTFHQLYEKDIHGLYVIITDDMKINSYGLSNVITIQHGISWDFPRWAMSGFFQKYDLAFRIRKIQKCMQHVSLFKRASHFVCVDYNYYNWLRTLYDISDKHIMSVVPNYAQGIGQEEFEAKIKQEKNLTKAKIVFARRMTRYRGALLFAKVADRLLKSYPDISITFAGDGDYLDSLKERFAHYSNVSFTTYQPSDSVDFHKQFDIAVVPTIYSEGTSLSLAEAMAAGCMPVATHIGGMTNMILDGYNGYLSYPDENALYEKITAIMGMSWADYEKVLRNSFESASVAFSKRVWECRWEQIINKVVSRL